jgi:hypothetical protein
MSIRPKDEKIPTAQRIRIPVRYIDGHWELAYGGAVKVKNGSAADLVIPREQIDDAALLRALTAKRWVRILEEGTELRLALTVRTKLDPDLSKLLVKGTSVHSESMGKLSGETQFVAVNLGPPTKAQTKRKETKGGLWLALEGIEPRALESSAVFLPEALDLDPAISVNHAFTRLSERFEPWRLSHTGSIYERVFYKEADGFWYPLDDLRQKEMVAAERKIIRALWHEVERLLKNPL